jgi:alcohol dehydrogenase
VRAIVFHEHGPVSKLHLEEFPDPAAGPKDVVLRVKATSLNGFDPMILAGTTGLDTPLPMIPCGDIAGEIVALGAEVDAGDWKVGDRVCPHPFVLGEGMTGETRLGAACEYVRIPAANLIRIPDAVSDVEAASLPIAYGAAYRMMKTRGRVEKGEKVLVLGAAGGVGTCCVQLAKVAGAEVVAAASAAWKLGKLREIGADHVIDTSKEDFVEAVHGRYGKPRMFGGGGVDVIVNYIGGDTWARSLRCLTARGRMLTCGATAGFDPPTDIRYIWSYEQQVIGSNGWLPQEQAALLEMVAEGKLAPVLHAVRALEETPRSIQELIDRQVVGKTVIAPGPGGASDSPLLSELRKIRT